MQNNDCINKLKYLKHKSIDIFYNYKWENLDNVDFNDDKCFKIRLLYKPSSCTSTPSNFLNKYIWVHNAANHLIAHSIKLLALIEQNFFKGDKICYDQLMGAWIIPINISLFLPLYNQIKDIGFSIGNYCDKHFTKECECVDDDYGTFIIQILKNTFETLLIEKRKKLFRDFCRVYIENNNTLIINLPNNNVFTVIWIQDFSTLAYCKCKYKYFDENKEIIIKKYNLNLVEIYDKKAIIIPNSSNLDFLFNNIAYTLQDLKDCLTQIYKIELHFTDNLPINIKFEAIIF